MENTSKKTMTHTETKPKRQILLSSCLPYSFAIEKRIFFFFICFPFKYFESTRL